MKLIPTITGSTASRAASKQPAGMPGRASTVLAHSPWSAEPDHGLMLRISEGNRAAFTELARRYMPAMLAFARRYVIAAEAEDILQEALTRCWLKAGQWQDRGLSVKAWLLRIVYNLCMDSLRRQPAMAETGDEPVATGAGPEQALEQERQQQQLQAALQALPERQRTAIMLTIYHALSNREAAEIIGVSLEALESLLSRARRSLKQATSQQRGES